MFILALCLVGTALAAPATPEEPMVPAESHYLVSPYIYPSPILPLRMIIKAEETELLEPKEELPEAPELPKLEPIVKLDPSKPLSFFTNWINSFPSFNLPNLPTLPFIGGLFPPSNNARVYLPAFYPGYPEGPMIIEPAKL